MTAESALTESVSPSRGFFGHPTGLAYIVFTEAFERFSFYGMQALLVLYMATHLLLPGTIEGVVGFASFRSGVESVFGPLSTQALASQVFGLYVGLVYFMPVVGGLIGDRILGQTTAVVWGGVLMAIGHFLMAFEASFLFALSALILGSGLLKGNLAAQVGALYAKEDQRRDSAFSIYTVAINVGAFLAPLVCGTLGEVYGWHYGFGVAGVGMLIGLAIYLSGRNQLPPNLRTTARAEAAKMTSADLRVVVALVVLFVIGSLFWIAQSQVWNTYPLWIKDRVVRDQFGLTVPVTWFQSLDSLAVLMLAPVVLVIWRIQSRRGKEPDDLTKIVIGCSVFAFAMVWLSVGEIAAAGGKVGLVWPTVFHFLGAVAFLYVWPVILSLVSRSAPVAINAMMVGAAYLAIFAGGTASGWLGGFYEKLSAVEFWLLHGAISAAGAALALLVRPMFHVLQAGKGGG